MGSPKLNRDSLVRRWRSWEIDSGCRERPHHVADGGHVLTGRRTTSIHVTPHGTIEPSPVSPRIH